MALGSVFILGGLALLIYADWATVLPVVLVVIGTIEIFSGRIKKFYWLRKHGKGKGVYFYIPEVVAGPDAIRFLALPPGWRFLIDGGL